MNVEARKRPVAVSLAFATFASVAAILLGSLTLLGWVINAEFLRTFFHSGRISMNPATATCFILSGAALWLARESSRSRTRRRDLAGMILAAAVLAIGGLKVLDLVLELTTSVRIPVDRVLFTNRLGSNRMAPNTALGFFFVGASLLLLERKHGSGPRPSTTLALLAAGISVLALTGYLYDVRALYGIQSYIGMALNTGLGLLLLSLGILCSRPKRQPLATLVSSTAGGVVARRLVPVALAVPLLIGWLRLQAERAGIIEGDVGVLLFALAIVCVFLTLIWWIARALYRLDLARAAAQARLDDNYQLMRTLIDNLPDRIYAKDRDSHFLISNLAHARILGGHRPEDVQGKRDEDFWPADVAQQFHDEERKIIESGDPLMDHEQRRTTREGEERWVTVTKVPFRNTQGEVAGIVGITHDITARKHAHAMLREQNEMLEQAMRSEHEAHEALKRAQSQLVQNEKLASLGQMVAGVAHEINNPLSFVANNVAVLQRDLRALGDLLELYRKSDESLAQHQPQLAGEIKELSERVDLNYTLPNLQELLTRSREGLRRIQQIVKDLRDFARLDESDLHEVDLNEGIRSTVNIILGVAKKKRVKVEMDLAPLPPFSCYPAKINQVVMNLLANAIDASNEGAAVHVRSRKANDSVVIEVQDAGSGIPAHVKDRIFDPFFTTKPPGEGTGLGLSISYGIAHDHGGRIDVQSEVGQGSTFTVTLPIHPPPAPPPKA